MVLLCSGGDDRIELGRGSGRNAYGCAPSPQPETISFSSSTASTLSSRAYVHARRAQERLIEEAAVHGLEQAFDNAMENTRRTLRHFLGLHSTGDEIVLAPSGTDAQLAALFLAREAFASAPTSCIVVGSDQTGSGTAFSAAGQHFCTRTALGKPVRKGTRVFDHGLDLKPVFVPFGTDAGSVRTPLAMDEAVMAAVETEIRLGRKVVLQTMAASKFGWMAPSEACVARIQQAWPDAVRVVVDACQMRLSASRIRMHLAEDRLVLITGSKFYGGPAFSGAILLPRLLSVAIARRDRFPHGLGDYLTRSDLPQTWTRLRSHLTLEPNFGHWLRWVAALEEMRAYHLLAPSYRSQVIHGVAANVAIAMAGCSRIQPIEQYDRDGKEHDNEFTTPTIFPFVLRDKDGYLAPDQVSEIHRALNRDILWELERSDGATPAILCHIGQPVQVIAPGNTKTAALRFAIGARTLFEAWSPGPDAAARAIRAIACNVGTVLRKLDLVLDHPAIWTASNDEPRILSMS